MGMNVSINVGLHLPMQYVFISFIISQFLHSNWNGMVGQKPVLFPHIKEILRGISKPYTLLTVANISKNKKKKKKKS